MMSSRRFSPPCSQAWTHGRLQGLQSRLELADFQRLERYLGQIGQGAGAGDGILQREGVKNGDHQQSADLGDVVQPLEVVGAGDGLLLAASESAEPSRLRRLLGVVGRVEQAEVAVLKGGSAAGLAVVLAVFAGAGRHLGATSADRGVGGR
jgi:hypothetical protein